MFLKSKKPNKTFSSFKTFGLGFAVGAILGYKGLARHGKISSRKIFYLKRWEKQLASHYGKAQAHTMAARVLTEYQQLCADTTPPPDRALRFHLYQSILPGLALYRVLLEQGLSKKAALVEVDQIFSVSFSAGTKLMRFQLPGVTPFELLRKTFPWSLKLLFPESGWKKEWVENSPTSFAFNMHSCFYLDVLAAHGARELTTIYCKFDDLMFNNLPASIRWERTQTLGRGHELCNFRWSNQDSQLQPQQN